MTSIRRLSILKGHLQGGQSPGKAVSPSGISLTTSLTAASTTYPSNPAAVAYQDLQRHKQQWHKDGVRNVEVSAPPAGCEEYYRRLLNPDAVAFVADLVKTFSFQVEQLLRRRTQRKLELDDTGLLPDFPSATRHIREADWSVRPAPKRLRCRHVDLGDVSPSNSEHFVAALNSPVQGIQTDFDDGHCPSWANQLKGLHNVYMAVHNDLPGVPEIGKAPVLMLRPRAWNMLEHGMLVDGKQTPGPLFDFGILMFHNAHRLIAVDSGPFFYLSKLEGHLEARLWNQVFVWAQEKLGIPVGTIKACVLIENVLASFEMEEILYELRDHSAGLNCGIWDYAASFVNKFGTRPSFVLPDRVKYVSMERHFLKSYMDLVVRVCHGRGAHATGGMSALLLKAGQLPAQTVRVKVKRDKSREIQAGVDGFMVYDLGLVPDMHQLFSELAPGANQLHVKRTEAKVDAKDLLQIPKGGVTLSGLKHNIGVGILFIAAWLQGKGHYYYKGAVEDSATAEISRSQVWQWIRHCTRLEESGEAVTRHLVQNLVRQFVQDQVDTSRGLDFSTNAERYRLHTAAHVFMDIVSKYHFPEFITTYLNHEHAFLKAHGMYGVLAGENF